jgi:hypothetical protein
MSSSPDPGEPPRCPLRPAWRHGLVRGQGSGSRPRPGRPDTPAAGPGPRVRIIYDDLSSDDPPHILDITADRRAGTTARHLLWTVNNTLSDRLAHRHLKGFALAKRPLTEPPTYFLRIGS